MRPVKVNETDIQRYLFRKCHYIVVPDMEVHSGEELIATSEEGMYRFYVTDSLVIRGNWTEYSICTVENLTVVQ